MQCAVFSVKCAVCSVNKVQRAVFNIFVVYTIECTVCSVRCVGTAVHLAFNPLSQFIPQLKLYFQLQLSLWIDPITVSAPKST